MNSKARVDCPADGINLKPTIHDQQIFRTVAPVPYPALGLFVFIHGLPNRLPTTPTTRWWRGRDGPIACERSAGDALFSRQAWGRVR